MPTPERTIYMTFEHLVEHPHSGMVNSYGSETAQGSHEIVDAVIAAREQSSFRRLTIQEGEQLDDDGVYRTEDDRQTELRFRAQSIGSFSIEYQSGLLQRATAWTLHRNLHYAGAFSVADVTMLGWKKIKQLAQLPNSAVAFTAPMRTALTVLAPQFTDQPLPIDQAMYHYPDIRDASPAILLPATNLPTFRRLGCGSIRLLADLAAEHDFDDRWTQRALEQKGYHPDIANVITSFTLDTVMPAVHAFDTAVARRKREETIRQLTEAAL